MKFRKKPIVIDAMQFDGNNGHFINEWAGQNFLYHNFDPAQPLVVKMIIPTLEGDHNAFPFDWIVKGINGEFYPCKPDIFEKTYERVNV